MRASSMPMELRNMGTHGFTPAISSSWTRASWRSRSSPSGTPRSPRCRRSSSARSEAPVPAGFLGDVDALDPPDPAVAPVAPLGGDHQLPDEGAVLLGDEIEPLAGVGQDGGDAGGDGVGVERQALALQGQAAVE